MKKVVALLLVLLWVSPAFAATLDLEAAFDAGRDGNGAYTDPGSGVTIGSSFDESFTVSGASKSSSKIVFESHASTNQHLSVGHRVSGKGLNGDLVFRLPELTDGFSFDVWAIDEKTAGFSLDFYNTTTGQLVYTTDSDYADAIFGYISDPDFAHVGWQPMTYALGDVFDLVYLRDSNDPAGIFINNISSASVPVPAALWLLGSALLGICGVRSAKK